ncbi:MAG: prepilin-type N-terminal cleavage/methylation domain-containing protein [Idiomarina sp.]|nr:prepilin-type N-terminal cleavage/methylation domain-containing protein [Idiomarina sp.]
MTQRIQVQGFSLLELSIASAILSVGTLAVFTLTLYWLEAPERQKARYEALVQAVLERPQPMYIRRFATLECEREKE